MLIGREAECASIDAVLSEAWGGSSRALVLRGEAGIGKTALLSYAESHAQGWRVLRAAGTESEAELPFAALDQLLRPIRGHLAQIPTAQARALEVALALGAPAPADRFTAAVATLSILAAAADQGPVLCLVDDAHWLDASSAGALVFACRRLEAERIAVLFAAREGEDREFVAPDIPELHLGRIGEAAARSIVVATHPEIAVEAITRVVEIAQGNPLALLELPLALTEEQRAGADALPEPLPVTASVERAFVGRARTLPAETQRGLTIAAASDSDELHLLLRAFDALGLPADSLAPAERDGLIALRKGRFRFRHPLARSAVYQAADGASRRAAHRALADTLVAPDERARRAWHLAEATMGADEAVATELDAAGHDSRQRGAYATAASAFERSAQLSDDPESRARRLLAAAEMLWIAGQTTRANAVVIGALEGTSSPALHADLEAMRARISIWSGSALEASQRLRDVAERAATIEPGRAALLMAEAVLPCLIAGNVQLALTTATRAMDLAATVGGVPVVLASLGLAQVMALRGESARARELLRGVPETLDKIDPLGPGKVVVASCLLWLEAYDDAHHILGNVISAARTQGAVVVLPFALGILSDYECRVGSFAAAYAAATESVALAQQTGQDAEAGFSYASLARSEAVLGHEDSCRAHAQHAFALAKRAGAESVRAYGLSALGLLDLGLGNPAAALTTLVPLSRLVRSHGVEGPATVQWGPDLVQAYIELGSVDQAKETLRRFADQAERAECNWALATAARCRGLLASDDDFVGEFENALELHDRTPTPFERARTELSYGQRLRRGRSRRKSRELLHSALATFDRLGAGPWARRTVTEVRASGETLRRRGHSAQEHLTAQELQVALIVAEGATNREAAARLFLSPKTIEFHLSHVFRKLGVRSRTELARRLARESLA